MLKLLDISRKLALKYKNIKNAIIFAVVAFFSLSACTPSHKQIVDELNSKSYAFHYRNLDSARYYARQALKMSDGYRSGQAEALNNLAFVRIVYMDYDGAHKMLNAALSSTDNQIELLISDVQFMRLCQRESKNKDFYDYHERAMARLNRILEDFDGLDERQKKRLLYAKSELSIVTATYYYYIGLDRQFRKTLKSIDPHEVQNDTAQYLNYLYNMGAGDVITDGTPEEIAQQEFQYLSGCYMLAVASNYPYWEANSLQALSEHFQNQKTCKYLRENNIQQFDFINIDEMPDSLIAGNLADRSLNLFRLFGDSYQTAGAYRTLAECYWNIQDYKSAILCLENSLKNKVINRAPDLVASIREQLSLAYSALDIKQQSDYNRNIYLDLQEQTRQDRMLESRAEQLDRDTMQLNLMIISVITVIIILIALLLVFDRMRRRGDKKNSIDKLLVPLMEWNKKNEQKFNDLEDKYDEVNDTFALNQLHILNNKKRNLEQRAKVQLVNTVTPLIDRMLNEINRLRDGNESEDVKARRYQYIIELTDQINAYNERLTEWIQMRQGELSLHIESFPLSTLFDFVRKGNMSFKLKGISLDVKDTDAVVKADKTLTLFMINTICDNSRKFTEEGGKVSLKAETLADCVEISISDTGKGMNEEELKHVFDRTYTGGHGFGLLNCKGIIEKYKKVSTLFNVCDIRCFSEVGKGSQFIFRLPKGIAKKTLLLLAFLIPAIGINATSKKGGNKILEKYADSVYYSNIHGNYQKTLAFGDTAIHYFNEIYLKSHPGSKMLMKAMDSQNEIPAEIKWYRDSVRMDYVYILSVRNEIAVASLALHDWDRYKYNNGAYTQLYRETTADNTLDNYVKTMQKNMNSKTVSIILLILLLIMIFPAYYFLYYRHQIFYRLCVEKIKSINRVLLEDISEEDKLQKINKLWTSAEEFSAEDSTSTQPLNKVVSQIKDALQKSIDVYQQKQESIELAEDELNRAKYEDDKLHISNSVLDNCLSTLKHETMYYPSRIRQLIDGTDTNIEAISELADYYKSLYSMLSLQCMHEFEGNLKFDKDIFAYLFDILKKQIKVKNLKSTIENFGTRYILVKVDAENLQLTDEECKSLFTPFTLNPDYLLCRQIVRDIGEITNARGCGISANKQDGKISIDIILPETLKTVVQQYTNLN